MNALIEDKELGEKMGKNGREYVEKEHDVRKIAKKYIGIFEDVYSN